MQHPHHVVVQPRHQELPCLKGWTESLVQAAVVGSPAGLTWRRNIRGLATGPHRLMTSADQRLVQGRRVVSGDSGASSRPSQARCCVAACSARFLSTALTGADQFSIHPQLGPEGLCMVGPGLGDRVAGLQTSLCQDLLKAGLKIQPARRSGPVGNDRNQKLQHQLGRRLITTIEVYRTQQCLDNIGEDRILVPTPGSLFALAKEYQLADTQLPGHGRQGLLVHDRSSYLRHLAFCKVLVRVVEMTSDCQLENGITKELQPLVGDLETVLRRIGTMG